MNALALAAHLITAVIWIGGMFFAYVILRPAVSQDEPAKRLMLWRVVFKKFFPWVKLCILVLLLTGYTMVFGVYGGFGNSPFFVHAMHLLAWLMVAIYAYLFVRPYRQFKEAVDAEQWMVAGSALNQIRIFVLVNLTIGLLLLFVVSAGRYI